MYSWACLNKDGVHRAVGCWGPQVWGCSDFLIQFPVLWLLLSNHTTHVSVCWEGSGVCPQALLDQCLGLSHCSLLSANVPVLVFLVVLLVKLFPVNPLFTKTLNKDQLWACFLDCPIDTPLSMTFVGIPWFWKMTGNNFHVFPAHTHMHTHVHAQTHTCTRTHTCTLLIPFSHKTPPRSNCMHDVSPNFTFIPFQG